MEVLSSKANARRVANLQNRSVELGDAVDTDELHIHTGKLELRPLSRQGGEPSERLSGGDLEHACRIVHGSRLRAFAKRSLPIVGRRSFVVACGSHVFATRPARYGCKSGMRARTIVSVAVSIVIFAAACSNENDRSPAARSPAATQSGTCPKGVVTDVDSLRLDRAVRAARRLIPGAYRPLLANGERYFIAQVLSLRSEIPPLPGAAHWRRIATNRCGREIAAASWVVAITFPDKKVVVPTTGIAFITHTRSGWRLWYRYR
jgi:hypothetical protein